MSAAGLLLRLVPALAAAVLVDSFALASVGPERFFDPYLVLVVYFGARSERKTHALLAGAIVGLTQDGLGSSVFGVHYLAKVVVAYGVSRAAERFIPGQPLTWAVLLGGATVAELAVYRALGFLLGQSFDVRSWPAVAALLVLNVLVGTLACSWVRARATRGGHAVRAGR